MDNPDITRKGWKRRFCFIFAVGKTSGCSRGFTYKRQSVFRKHGLLFHMRNVWLASTQTTKSLDGSGAYKDRITVLRLWPRFPRHRGEADFCYLYCSALGKSPKLIMRRTYPKTRMIYKIQRSRSTLHRRVPRTADLGAFPHIRKAIIRKTRLFKNDFFNATNSRVFRFRNNYEFFKSNVGSRVTPNIRITLTRLITVSLIVPLNK